MNEGKVGFLGPEFVMAAIAALMSDFAFVFLLALLIPIIGLIIALMIIMFHYFAGLILLFLIFPKLKHLLPKLVLILAVVLPLPLLAIGVVLAIVLQNRLIEFVVTQAAIQTIAVATGGAGEVLEVGAAAAEAGAVAAEAGVAAAEAGAVAAEAGVAAAEAGAVAETTEVAGAGVRATETAKPILQQPIEEGVLSPQEPAVQEEAPEKPGSEGKSELDEDAKLEKRKKAIGDYWEKTKREYEEGEEKKRREKEEKSDEL
jgi:hypothetical protein